jgi:hypothetical protein
LLVRRPGTGDNYAVIEVKTCRVENRDIDKDLATLARFVELEYHYRRAVYLIYGPDTNGVSHRVRERAAVMGMPPFELWLHQAAGVAAENTVIEQRGSVNP